MTDRFLAQFVALLWVVRTSSDHAVMVSNWDQACGMLRGARELDVLHWRQHSWLVDLANSALLSPRSVRVGVSQ